MRVRSAGFIIARFMAPASPADWRSRSQRVDANVSRRAARVRAGRQPWDRVCDRVTVEITSRGSPVYVFVEYGERETDWSPSPMDPSQTTHASRGIRADSPVPDHVSGEGIALARLIQTVAGWNVDTGYRRHNADETTGSVSQTHGATSFVCRHWSPGRGRLAHARFESTMHTHTHAHRLGDERVFLE